MTFFTEGKIHCFDRPRSRKELCGGSMRKDELLEMIANGESSKVEFKTDDVHPNALAEEIVAFDNFEGGTILIGVDDSGEIKGYTRNDIEEFVP